MLYNCLSNRRFFYSSPLLALLAAIGLLVIEPTNATRLDRHVVEVRPLALGGPASKSSNDYQGLAWFGDQLIMLPRYPAISGNSLYTLSRQQLEFAVTSQRKLRLRPASAPLKTPDGLSRLRGFNGFGAIAFDGEKAAVSSLTSAIDGNMGYLSRGRMGSSSRRLALAFRSVELPAFTRRRDGGYSSLVGLDEGYLAIYDRNGSGTDAKQYRALFVEHDRSFAERVPMVEFPFRITDATALDSQGRFWVTNSYYDNFRRINADNDVIAERFGPTNATASGDQIARLVELQWRDGAITFSGRPPIYLAINDDTRGRVWEGVVRLPGQGFLLLSSQRPASVLGFVPWPDGESAEPENAAPESAARANKDQQSKPSVPKSNPNPEPAKGYSLSR